MPGVIAGSVIRVELLPSAHVFDLVVAAVLIPLGISIALIRPRTAACSLVTGKIEVNGHAEVTARFGILGLL